MKSISLQNSDHEKVRIAASVLGLTMREALASIITAGLDALEISDTVEGILVAEDDHQDAIDYTAMAHGG